LLHCLGNAFAFLGTEQPFPRVLIVSSHNYDSPTYSTMAPATVSTCQKQTLLDMCGVRSILNTTNQSRKTLTTPWQLATLRMTRKIGWNGQHTFLCLLMAAGSMFGIDPGESTPVKTLQGTQVELLATRALLMLGVPLWVGIPLQGTQVEVLATRALLML
jgi:hypothetical protein